MILCYQHGIVHSSQFMMTLQILFSYLCVCVCFGQKLSSDSRSSVDSMAACVSESQSLCQHEHQQQQQLTEDALKQVTTWTQSAALGLESRGQELDVFLKQELREDVPTGMGSQTQVRAIWGICPAVKALCSFGVGWGDQTPSSGLWHSSSNHCHDWLRHRSANSFLLLL